MSRVDGHAAFPLPPDQEWRRTGVLDAVGGRVVSILRDAADTLERDVPYVATNPDIQSPYADWIGQSVAVVANTVGNLAPHLRWAVSYAADVDAVLREGGYEQQQAEARIRQLEHLATAVVAHPSSAKARAALAEAIAGAGT